MITGFEPNLTVEEVMPLFPELCFLDTLRPGSEGAVFKCSERVNNSEVLLKIYGANRVIRRTELEIEKMQIAQSPFLATLISNGKKTIRGAECYYLTTQFINGINLKDFMDRGNKLNSKQVEKMIIDISSAIQALWDASVVHSDIKPENIILSNEGDFVLIDLGVAKHLDAEQITAVTVLCYGTEGYLAPEQFKGRKNLTLRADFYALGITAWQMIVGMHPFGYNQMLMNQQLPALPGEVTIRKELADLICKLAHPQAYRRPVGLDNILKILGRR